MKVDFDEMADIEYEGDKELAAELMQGEDMNVYYPILKTYMGHSFFKYTAYYLKLTQNMYPDICEKLSRKLGDIILEIGGDWHD